MIVPDVNLLVYAYNDDAPFHDAAKTWWKRSLSGTELVGLPWIVIAGFARVMSNRRVLREPINVEEALVIAASWIRRPNVMVVSPGTAHMEILSSLVREVPIGSALVTDAHLAAIAIEHQAELHSNDSDFRRFSGLRWRNPVR